MSYRVQKVDDEFVSNKNKKDKAGVKYPKKFSKKVSMAKVNFSVVEKWIGDTLNEQLPDDDVVIDYVSELLQAEDQPDIKMIHLQMQDFLGKEQAMNFCETLWDMLMSAQDDPDGIPAQLLEQRRKEYEEGQDRDRVEKPKTNYNRSGAGKSGIIQTNLNKDRGRSYGNYEQNRRDSHRNTRDDRDRDPKDIRTSKSTRYRDDRKERSYKLTDYQEYDSKKR
ncbi:uncharacterized protein AC631_00003 [Debaryomyces fabryi]|uniref:U1 small nuclear ribonucleoprotein component SNU71 n=1 Tax=Debaryomyces fabryi TaxID=58627 RepID=A0A0V1Q6H3_9ASCO|nr:uncharacterized protein AC631_00003 [Debaryomyces fabryi]KSA04132.1 hypothetical protein AC631_00003 [Debaryomyces fabryi]CUM46188.1 unnamed protein product [Debaryomyces fabryi]